MNIEFNTEKENQMTYLENQKRWYEERISEDNYNGSYTQCLNQIENELDQLNQEVEQ